MNHQALCFSPSLLVKLLLGWTCALGVFPASTLAADPMVDLTQAVVVPSAKLTGPEKKAVAMLIDEVEKRTQIRWKEAEANKAAVPMIAVFDYATERDAQPILLLRPPIVPAREGYTIRVDQTKETPLVLV